MILSFHPIIEADENRICAGRLPDATDLAAICRADAVILSQGSSEALYRMARANCPYVFPNQNVRFDFPGKMGQIRLFRKLGVAHPQTLLVDRIEELDSPNTGFDFPWVVKLNWGGQGDGVWLIKTQDGLRQIRKKLRAWENTGQSGFLVQEWINDGGRSLRVTIIGHHTITYWRVRSAEQPFGTGVSHGAEIDFRADGELQQLAEATAHRICRDTGLNLAGFDFLFSQEDDRHEHPGPLVLEINHFFGRTGLGGSQSYYRLLTSAVDHWLNSIGLSRSAVSEKPL